MKIKGSWIIGWMIVFFISATSLVYAYEEVFVENKLSTGNVNIELKEYRLNTKGERIPWENPKDVLPGDVISKIPQITNLSESCYVRVKLNMDADYFKMEQIHGISEKWIYAKDGYLYYTEPLIKNASIDVFKEIQVPVSLDASSMEKDMMMDIVAEAVQSQNFQPDFDSDHPWGELKIETCEKESENHLEDDQGNSYSFEIVYEGTSGKFIKNEDNFFKNIPKLMPGDVYNDHVKVRNDSKDHVFIYFRTDSIENDFLLKEMKLNIWNDQHKIIYSGDIIAKDLNKGILLMELKESVSKNMYFEIMMPENLGNSYALLNEKVKWIFYTDIQPKTQSVQTGDDKNLFIALLFCLPSGMIMIYMIKRRRIFEQNQSD